MRSVVLVSGGLDSTVLLAKLVAEGRSVVGFGVDYGQRHAREIASARAVCKRLGVGYKLLELPSLKDIFGANSLTDRAVDVHEGPYEEEGMKNTVVPARNLILISLATAFAISEKRETVAYAAHGGDHAIYPDCRPEFAEKLNAVVQISDWHKVRLERPFMDMTKAEIVKLGHELGAPMELTWSCYKGGELHCGKCATCLERKAAFEKAKVEDLTEYGG